MSKNASFLLLRSVSPHRSWSTGTANTRLFAWCIFSISWTRMPIRMSLWCPERCFPFGTSRQRGLPFCQSIPKKTSPAAPKIITSRSNAGKDGGLGTNRHKWTGVTVPARESVIYHHPSSKMFGLVQAALIRSFTNERLEPSLLTWLSQFKCIIVDRRERWGSISLGSPEFALEHLCFACAEMLSAPTRAREQTRRRPAATVRFITCREIHRRRHGQTRFPQRPAASAASQSAALCARTTRRRDFSRDARGAGERVGSLPRVQAGHRNVTAVRDARADHLAQQLIRALLCKSLEVGWSSHFTEVFRRVTDMMPAKFRSSL